MKNENTYVEFQATSRFMIFLAKIFGRKISNNVYMWRGKMWICGEIKE